VTNSLSFLPEVDEIIMLENGNILEMGSYDVLVKNDSHFAKFIENYFTSSNQEEEPEEMPVKPVATK
jgi:ABC-type multidrug transport system fused ATPase/permease subunit